MDLPLCFLFMRLLSRLFLLLVLAAGAFAQAGSIFLVRHAEKQSDDKDTPLSAKGHARAECLAQTLKDAHITAVFTSQYQRTKQTAEVVAREFELTQKSIDATAYAEFAEAAKNASKSGNVLIVGHSNTVPGLIQKLGGPPVTIPDTSYDQLFVIDAEHPERMIVLHYCTELPTDNISHPANSMAKP